MKRGKIKTVTEMDINKRLAILHFDTSFYWSVAQTERERKWRKEVRRMSEEQKKLSEKIAALVDKLPEDGKEIAIAYMRGMADAARAMQEKSA